MTRSTHKDERGYYLTGDGIYVDDGDPAKFRGADVDRLAAYEDTELESEDVIEERYGRWGKRRSAMKRMTFDGNFCDIAMCGEVRGGSFCENGSCSQREVWERLKALEDILGDEYDLDRLRELIQADRDGRCFISPFIAMVEQSLTNGKMTPRRDQRFNGRYAVVYFDREKYAAPLIDICGKPYDRIEAENRVKELRQKEALSALKREEAG